MMSKKQNHRYKNTFTRLERFCHSFSSRKRIEILDLLSREDNLTLKEIMEKIHAEKQNASLHTFKLLNEGLIAKKKNKTTVEHSITKRGLYVLEFLQNIDKKI